MSLIHYKSNPDIPGSSGDIGEVSLEKDFIFSAYIEREVNSDYHLEFSAAENSFTISNKQFDNFTFTDKKLISDSLPVKEGTYTYFGEVFEIKKINSDFKLYKKVTAEDSPTENWLDYYIKGDDVFARNDSNKKYELIKIDNNFHIVRNCESQPLQIDANDTSIVLYDNDNFFNNIGSHWFRVVVSNRAGLITFWLKADNENNYKKMKTFSFTKRFSKGGIKLSVDDSMELNQLSFSFLQANV